MPDQPDGENREQGQTNSNTPRPEAPPPKKQGTGEGEHAAKDEKNPSQTQQPPSRWSRFGTYFTKAEWVNVFLTCVIAGTGVVGIILIIQGGADTQKMIKAAQQQACAAQQFSATAKLINGNINDAVGKLDTQATAMQNASAAAFAMAGAEVHVFVDLITANDNTKTIQGQIRTQSLGNHKPESAVIARRIKIFDSSSAALDHTFMRTEFQTVPEFPKPDGVPSETDTTLFSYRDKKSGYVFVWGELYFNIFTRTVGPIQFCSYAPLQAVLKGTKYKGKYYQPFMDCSKP